MSATAEFPLDREDVETLRRIERRMESADVGCVFVALLPFLSIGGSAIGTAVSVSSFRWSEWAEAVRSNAFDVATRHGSRNDAFSRWLDQEGVDAKRDPHIHARRRFWERLYGRL